MIDQAKKNALIRYIKEQEYFGRREILLPPGLFFDGYEDEHCNICINSLSISTVRFADYLRELGERPDVSGVFIRFYDYLDALEFEDAWIGSDTVYVVTSASAKDVREWFAGFNCSDVREEYDHTSFSDIPPLPEGFRLVAVWWD